MFKTNYMREPYLDVIKNDKYRVALSRFRASSHTLEIERGRYTRPITHEQDRLCAVCNVIENEMHFLMACEINSHYRAEMFRNITALYSEFSELSVTDQFLFLLKSNDEYVLNQLAKFVFKSFKWRNERLQIL